MDTHAYSANNLPQQKNACDQSSGSDIIWVGESCFVLTPFQFDHDLGSCALFVHIMELYRRRGYKFTLACSADKEILFRASGVEVIDRAEDTLPIPWYEAGWWDAGKENEVWRYNKSAINVNCPPLPYIGEPEEWWLELSAVALSIEPFLPEAARHFVDDYLSPLPRPIVLVQTTDHSSTMTRHLPSDLAEDLYKHLLDEMDGTLILLDWGNPMPRLANWRVRHLRDDWTDLPTEHFLALLSAADCFIGVDGDGLQAASLTDLPTIGLFPDPAHYPTRSCLPRGRQVNLVPHATHGWNRTVRIAYNIVESAGDSLDPRQIAQSCTRMLSGARYLGADQLGADIQMQQFVLEWERGNSNQLTSYTDRHRSFDVLLQETQRRFTAPLIVETGCIRVAEDWRGAGYGTYLLGAYLQRTGGRLISVDIDPRNCQFARDATLEMPCVSIVCQDSVAFLQQWTEPIDVLFLDSVDTYSPLAISHAVNEIRAALPRLHEESIVMFDDTVYQSGAFHGKGTEAVPWLLAQGWRILFSGYQTICVRDVESG